MPNKVKKECSQPDCVRLHHARGWCRLHYERWRRGQSLDAPYYQKRRQAFFDWAACGTSAQYKKHLRHKIPVCEPCRKAENRRKVDRYHQQDHERYNARRRERWAANPEYYRRRQRESRALKR